MRPRRLLSLSVAAALALLLTVPNPAGAGAADTDPLAGYPDGAQLLDGGKVAVPLREKPPAWLTDDLRRRASEAAELGMGVDAETGQLVSPAAALQYAFIRPGTWMVYPSWCTMAFVTGRPGSYSITTAGHCLPKGGGGPLAGNHEVIVVTAPSLIFAVGRGSGHAGGVGNDYGDVDVYDQFQPFVDPNTAVIGGPGLDAACGSSSVVATATNPVPVKHFGHGVVVGTGGTARTGVSTHADNRDPLIEGGFSDNAVYWYGAATPGDSGSPVMAAATPGCPLGEALAILTHLVVVGHNAQYIAGTHVSKLGQVAVTNPLADEAATSSPSRRRR